MRKAEEQTTSMIFIVGFIALVAIFVSAAYIGLGDIQTPVEQVQTADGDRDEVAAQLAEMSDRCWEQGDEGMSSQVIDCYEIHVDVDEEVTEEHILRDAGVDEDQFSLPEPIPAGADGTVKVRYEPGEVMVTLFDISVSDGNGDDTPDTDNGEDIDTEFLGVIDDVRDTVDDALDDAEDASGEDLDDIRDDIHDTLDDVEDVSDIPAVADPDDLIPAAQADPCDALDDAEDEADDRIDDAEDEITDGFDDARDDVRDADLDQNVEQDILDALDDAEDAMLDALDDIHDEINDMIDDMRNQHGC